MKKTILSLILCSTLIGCGGGGSSPKAPEESSEPSYPPTPTNPIPKGLSPSASVPVLLYHSWNINYPCDYENSDIQAFTEDLETLHENGFTIVPLQHLIEWHQGIRSGEDMPEKPVAITLDDGHDLDWIDGVHRTDECPDTPSIATILYNFKMKHNANLPEYSPHATTFVIASEAVRNGLGQMSHGWWKEAHDSEVMSVQNHSIDHDHDSITEATYDENIGYVLPAGAHTDGDWWGKGNPDRIKTEDAADLFIAVAGEYIGGITGEIPTIFSHPYGIENEYLIKDYLPNNVDKHSIKAAVCTERGKEGKHLLNMMTKESNIYCIPRLTFGSSWKTKEEFQEILNLIK